MCHHHRHPRLLTNLLGTACYDRPQVYAEGTQVYARMGTVIHTWDAFMPDSARIIKVDVSACNVPGTKDQATHLDKAEVRGGKLMFTANFPFGDDPDTVQLCATDLTTGKTTPLLTDPQYTRGYDSLEVLFFDNAVLYVVRMLLHLPACLSVCCLTRLSGRSLSAVLFSCSYTSSGGTINVGDPVACLISSPSAAGKSQCYWLNSDIMQNGNYAFTKLYTNYHIPSNPDGLYQWTIYEDVVLYRTCTILCWLCHHVCVLLPARSHAVRIAVDCLQTRRRLPTVTLGTT